MNFYKHFIGDYQRDTMHLTMMQDGAYRRLLDACYATERGLPVENDHCYRLARAFDKAERDAVDAILSQFFPVGEDGLRHNKRAVREVGSARLLSEKARQASLSRESYGSIRSQRIRDARTRGRHTEPEWAALLEFCGNQCVKCGESGSLAKDHIIPICNGGSDAIQNLQPLCNSCNSSKGPDPTDWRKQGWLDYVRKSCAVANDTANDTANAVEIDSEQDASHSHSHSHSHSTQPEPDTKAKKSKAKVAATPLPSWLPQEPWNAYVEMRGKKRKPMTEKAVELIHKKLGGLRVDGQDIEAVLWQSVENGWTGVFPVKPNGSAGNSVAEHNRKAAAEFLARQEKIVEGETLENQ